MSCTRKNNDDCHQTKKQCQSTSILPHVTPVERHQHSGTCPRQTISTPYNLEFHNKSSPLQRDHHLFSGQTHGWVDGSFAQLADIESELNNITRNLSYCPSGKHKPNSCHAQNGTCEYTPSHASHQPETSCKRILTNHSVKHPEPNIPNCNCK